MKAALYISLFAVSCTATLGGASAQSDGDANAFWDTFASTCRDFLVTPSEVIAKLPVPGPVGEPVLFRSVDGQVLQIDTVVNGFIMYAQFFATANVQSVDCTLSVPFGNAGNTNEHEAVFLQRTADLGLSVIGGPVNKMVPSGMDAPAVVPGGAYREYYFDGLIPDKREVGSASFGDGFATLYVNLTTHREQ